MIGCDVTKAIRDFFFISGKLPNNFASTLLVLIPKKDHPSNAKDYRPIACCSTVYKCISKLLCKILSTVLPVIVRENQGAFIKGRSIAHNVLILQDILRLYGRKNTSVRGFPENQFE